MPEGAFSYLEEDPENDHFSDVAREFERQQNAERETIAKANEYGNGYAPSVSPSEPYMPQKLNARHREIIRLHALGYKGTEIAKMIGCTPQSVYNITNSPLGVNLLEEIREARTGSVKDVHDRMQEMSPLAAEIMLDIMNDGEKESNRLRAAEKILEMTGHKAVDKHEHLHAHLTAEEIANLKQTAEDVSNPKEIEEASYDEDVRTRNSRNNKETNIQHNASEDT